MNKLVPSLMSRLLGKKTNKKNLRGNCKFIVENFPLSFWAQTLVLGSSSSILYLMVEPLTFKNPLICFLPHKHSLQYSLSLVFSGFPHMQIRDWLNPQMRNPDVEGRLYTFSTPLLPISAKSLLHEDKCCVCRIITQTFFSLVARSTRIADSYPRMAFLFHFGVPFPKCFPHCFRI